MGIRTGMIVFGAATLLNVAPQSAHADSSCAATFPSTFAMIQKVIFEDRGCTNSVCHGAAASGGLDLRETVAYENLVDHQAETVPHLKRVVQGQTDQSLLFLNLAAKTLPGQFHAPLRPMPLDPQPALSADELQAVRLWIQYGASRDGIVPGSGGLLNACLPPPKPISIDPLPPPPAGEGVQLHMPRWVLEPHSEHEVCFAMPFDLTDQVPPQFRDSTGTKLRISKTQIRQDPLSHHLVTHLYAGSAPLDDPAWGTFYCVGGANDGNRCDPTAPNECGTDGQCATKPVSGIACIGFGPPDTGIGLGEFGILGTQQTAVEHSFAEGVYAELPLKGMVLWNSHAFNLTNEPGKLEAWINMTFATQAEQQSLLQNVFDVTSIFKMVVPAFKTQEVCSLYKLPEKAQLFDLSSHTHKRGKRFRIFQGAFTCDGGSRNGQACSPYGPDPTSPDLCNGAVCRSTRTVRVGDCNLDGAVSVDELVQAVNIALGEASMNDCVRLDASGDRAITVDELVRAVNAELNGTMEPISRDADASLLYLNTNYNDPAVVHFDPPLTMPGHGALVDERSLTYCALYDNGFTHADEVKTRAGSPAVPIPGFPGIGGPCDTPTNCTAGQVGVACSGSNDTERNTSCDSSAGAGDGQCDACTLLGGVTTQDEMFVLLGSYFVK